MIGSIPGGLQFKDFMTEVSKGLVPGHRIVNKFGRNPDIDTGSVPESIWTGSSIYQGFEPTSAAIVNLQSTSPNDNPAGSGVGSVELEGLDDNGLVIKDVVTLNGTGIVPSNLEFKRIYRGKSQPPSTTGWNEGDITAVHSVGGQTMMHLQATKNQTHMALYTIPANETGFLMVVTATINDANNTSIEVDMFTREDGGLFLSKMPFGAAQGGGPVLINNIPLLVLPSLTDVDCRVLNTSSNNSDVTMKFDMLLVENKYLT